MRQIFKANESSASVLREWIEGLLGFLPCISDRTGFRPGIGRGVAVCCRPLRAGGLFNVLGHENDAPTVFGEVVRVLCPGKLLPHHVACLGKSAGLELVRFANRSFVDQWTGHSQLTHFLFRRPS